MGKRIIFKVKTCIIRRTLKKIRGFICGNNVVCYFLGYRGKKVIEFVCNFKRVRDFTVVDKELRESIVFFFRFFVNNFVNKLPGFG